MWSCDRRATLTRGSVPSTRTRCRRSPSTRRPVPITALDVPPAVMSSTSCERSSVSASMRRSTRSRDGLVTMGDNPSKTHESRRSRSMPTVSAVLPSGALVEMTYDPTASRSGFVVWEQGKWRTESSVHLATGHELVPYSPHNNLLRNEVVLLPSGPAEYGSDAELVAAIQRFIHDYTDLSPIFEKIASYYVLLSWIYDRFSE